MRTHNDRIAVRTGGCAGPAAVDVGEPDDRAPSQFVWRGRLYRVQSVQGCWVEASPWWDDPQVRRARGDEPASGTAATDDLLGERRVWRVVAAAGPYSAAGVYELSRRAGDWRLRGVFD